MATDMLYAAVGVRAKENLTVSQPSVLYRTFGAFVCTTRH